MIIGGRRARGFGILEIMVVLVVMALLVSLAVPAYTGFVSKARIANAIGAIGTISVQIDRYSLNNNDQLPDSLADLSMAVPLDPWGNSYQYLNIRDAPPGFGAMRKDGKLKPLNSDFDLFSMGADGEFAEPLSAMKSRDDILRANNGAFIGLGENY